MTYWTLAWLGALIFGLAIPAGAATLADGFFDEPIFPLHAYEQLVNIRAKTRGVIARNTATKTAVQESGMLAATTPKSKVGNIMAVDNALLVSVSGNAGLDKPLGNVGNANTYNESTVASVNGKFIGVTNVNVAAGNLNNQSTYYSGPDLSGLQASVGSTTLGVVRK